MLKTNKIHQRVYKRLNMKDYRYKWDYCIKCSKRTTSHLSDGTCMCPKCQMSLDDKFSPEDKQILSEIKKARLSQHELKGLLHGSKEAPQSGKPYSVPGKTITFGVFGDSHIGHKCFDARLMDYAIQEFNRRKVDFVVHTGDMCEGHYENRRQGSVLELAHIGGDAQVDEAVRHLSKLRRPLYFITGNHETNTFWKMAGIDIGKRIEEQVPVARNLGVQEGSIRLAHGQQIQVIHPDGGTAYAVSYKPQKIIESIDGGKKPAILLIGHFHKAEWMFYRNVQMLQTGTMESQTPFMKNNHIAAHKGFYVVTAEISKEGIRRFVPEFFPSY